MILSDHYIDILKIMIHVYDMSTQSPMRRQILDLGLKSEVEGERSLLFKINVVTICDKSHDIKFRFFCLSSSVMRSQLCQVLTTSLPVGSPSSRNAHDTAEP
jgi:hypothetical protein